MFSVYIDDSGTDPNQHIAIATAVIIPADKIIALEKEWRILRDREGFTDFHTSECVARNPKSEFGDWSKAKQRRVLRRVRAIGKKYGRIAFSIAVKKSDYDAVIPEDMRPLTGEYHYTWAMRSVIAFLDKWAERENINIPFEYVYDWMDPKTQREARNEIETVMAQAEELGVERGVVGRYVNYSFRKRGDLPALQCTDLVAWTCYKFALFAINKTPLPNIAQESWDDYYQNDKGWMLAGTMTKKQLEDWLAREQADGRWKQRLADWEASHPKKKK